MVGVPALTLALMVAGCSRTVFPVPRSTVASSSTPVPPPTAVIVPPTPTPRPILTTVDVALPGILDTLNPLLSQSAAARAIASLVFSGLVAPGADGQFKPDLAASWSSVDGLTWTFHLDTQRRWQDGVTFTARDVAYTVGLIDAANSPVDPALKRAWQGVQVMTPDSETVVLTVPPSLGANVLDLATTPILPAHLLATTPVTALALLPFSSHPVGSGAYRVAAANSLAVTLQLAENASLAPRQVHIAMSSTVVLPPSPAVPFGTGAVTLLGTGADGNAARTVRATLARPVFIFLNTHDPTFADVRLRQALNLAINRQQLIAGPLHGTAVALQAPFAGGLAVAEDAVGVATPSVTGATAALRDAGWSLSADNRWLRQGVPLTVTLLVDTDPTRLAVAQAIAGDWGAIGVPTTVEKVGLDGLLRDFVAPGHFQAVLLGVQQRGILPDLAELWHTGEDLNISGWSDPLADAALDATHSSDPDTQHTGYLRFAQRFADEVPAIPLYLPTADYAVSGVRLTIGTINDPADILRSLATWRATP